jgi:hypothetical protein
LVSIWILVFDAIAFLCTCGAPAIEWNPRVLLTDYLRSRDKKALEKWNNGVQPPVEKFYTHCIPPVRPTTGGQRGAGYLPADRQSNPEFSILKLEKKLSIYLDAMQKVEAGDRTAAEATAYLAKSGLHFCFAEDRQLMAATEIPELPRRGPAGKGPPQGKPAAIMFRGRR